MGKSCKNKSRQKTLEGAKGRVERKKERFNQLSKEIERLKLIQNEVAVEKMKVWEVIDCWDHFDEEIALRFQELCDRDREITREKNKLAIEKENIRIQLDATRVGHQGVGELAESANYQFACSFMLEAFFKTKIEMESLYKNESMTDLFYMSVLRGMRSYVGFSQKYRNLPTYYVKNKKGKGVVFGIPDAEQECECNYVALLEWENGERTYYTSEYYAMDGGFKLCEYTLDEHYAYDIRTDSLESFLKAIGFKEDGQTDELHFEGKHGFFRGIKEWIKNKFKAYRLRKIKRDRERLELKEETLSEIQGKEEKAYLKGD